MRFRTPRVCRMRVSGLDVIERSVGPPDLGHEVKATRGRCRSMGLFCCAFVFVCGCAII